MNTAITLIILILSVIVHEIAHGYAANSLGDPTARLAGRLTMNPIPHIDIFGSVIIPALLVIGGSPILFGWAKPVPYNPYNLRNQRLGEALVAIAGSATNIFLAIVFGLFARFGSIVLSTGGLTSFQATIISLSALIALVNLFLGLFNLIPFPPLDGFTVLRSLLPWRLSSGLIRLEHWVHSVGILSLVLFLIVFSYVFAEPFFNLVLWLFNLITGGI